jgi:Cu(I)/Ag(I) efflux system membrane fusion protein
MRPVRIFLLLLLVAAAFVAGYGYGRWYGTKRPGAEPAPQGATAKPRGYHCPMHPSFRSDKPGECAICGMRLVPDQEPASPAAAPHAMAPGAIHISAEKQQLIGVKFALAEAAGATRRFRAAGKVAVDETRIAKVQTKIDGWIDQVFVDFTGKLVEKGQPLLTLYSPEMLATEQEYLLALRSRDVLSQSPLAGARRQADSLVEAARKRLELWDLSAEQIAEITRTGNPIRNIVLHSPISGYVTVRNAFPNQRVTPETELYTIVDLSRVWILADVFENEAALVRLGMPARITPPFPAARARSARVSYIQPAVDPVTRTLKVRLEAPNPSLELKPEMFVSVDFEVALPKRLSVPADAVLDSGLRKIVFVDRGGGLFEPRQVVTGERFDDRIEILQGLKAGERVVTSGNFLLDSESQLKAAGAPSGHEGHQR